MEGWHPNGVSKAHQASLSPVLHDKCDRFEELHVASMGADTDCHLMEVKPRPFTTCENFKKVLLDLVDIVSTGFGEFVHQKQFFKRKDLRSPVKKTGI